MRCTWSRHVFQKNLGTYQELSLDTKSDYNKEHWVECSPGWNCIPFTIFAPNSKQLWTSWQSPNNVIRKGQILLCMKHVGKSCLDSLQLHASKSYFATSKQKFAAHILLTKKCTICNHSFKTCLNCRTICQSCSQCIGIKVKSYSPKHLICFYMSGSTPARGAMALLVSPAKPERINSICIHLQAVMGDQSRWLIHTCSGLNLDTGCGGGPGKDSASKSVSNGRAFAASACFAVFSKSSVNSSTCTMHEQNGRSVQYFLRRWSPVIMQTLHLWWRQTLHLWWRQTLGLWWRQTLHL